MVSILAIVSKAQAIVAIVAVGAPLRDSHLITIPTFVYSLLLTGSSMLASWEG
jgi:hypothetical protein